MRFALYDRDSQTSVPSVIWAQAPDYRKPTQRVYYTSQQYSTAATRHLVANYA